MNKLKDFKIPIGALLKWVFNVLKEFIFNHKEYKRKKRRKGRLP